MGIPVEKTAVDVAPDFTQLQLRFVDQIQWRYELIRPLVLFEARPTPQPAIRQRAQETATHPETVRKLTRRFEQQGLLGLVPDDVEIVPKDKATRVPAAVVEELARLKDLYTGFQYRELARILFYKTATGFTTRPSNGSGSSARSHRKENCLSGTITATL